jgi:hypothetical protein
MDAKEISTMLGGITLPFAATGWKSEKSMDMIPDSYKIPATEAPKTEVVETPKTEVVETSEAEAEDIKKERKKD